MKKELNVRRTDWCIKRKQNSNLYILVWRWNNEAGYLSGKTLTNILQDNSTFKSCSFEKDSKLTQYKLLISKKGIGLVKTEKDNQNKFIENLGFMSKMELVNLINNRKKFFAYFKMKRK